MIPLRKTKAKILKLGLSTEELQYQLRACTQLREYYKKAPVFLDPGCVLCGSSKVIFNSLSHTNHYCYVCPWKLLEGKTCGTWYREVYTQSSIADLCDKRRLREPEFCTRRAAMLSKWIRRYNAILKERLTNERSEV